MNNRPQILVVEDESHLAVGIKYNLEAEGYEVKTVGDGPTALKTLEDDAYQVDLVILDIMLPGMSGYAVCETIRDAGNDVPVLLLSARTLAEDRTRGFDAGANQYLTKPFDLDELLSRVNNLLKIHLQNRGKPQVSSVVEYSFGKSQINFETYEVTVADQPVRLTKQEMKLLRYFIDNESRVVPRSELLEKIWGMPGYINTRAPDQFIRRLRKMFEPDPAKPVHFLTIRDAGYRFVANPESAAEDSLQESPDAS
ncbi:MAG TPA: DNA-binding response regulator [Planctomycetaceae bacterium]|nr:DNA-binding response regulator [Blastopirellula sp.]HAY80820.1 DNA-binding response regulator [Planctomycetaceae bacterium]|tara:strand:- start:296 stop:1057 length:762 start_codon:yes stop_codon:yes gene_type:complete